MGLISTSSNRNNTMIVPTVHWKIFKPFLNILSNGAIFYQKNSISAQN
jgi:hypothetical protein